MNLRGRHAPMRRATATVLSKVLRGESLKFQAGAADPLQGRLRCAAGHGRRTRRALGTRAASRPSMRFVAIKNIEQQAVGTLTSVDTRPEQRADGQQDEESKIHGGVPCEGSEAGYRTEVQPPGGAPGSDPARARARIVGQQRLDPQQLGTGHALRNGVMNGRPHSNWHQRE